jgi:hypothetical protein
VRRDDGFGYPPIGVQQRIAGRHSGNRAVDYLVAHGDGFMQKRAVMVVSQVAELGIFFAAATALAVGLLGLR